MEVRLEDFPLSGRSSEHFTGGEKNHRP